MDRYRDGKARPVGLASLKRGIGGGQRNIDLLQCLGILGRAAHPDRARQRLERTVEGLDAILAQLVTDDTVDFFGRKPEMRIGGVPLAFLDQLIARQEMPTEQSDEAGES